jgi:Calcineurin-like phosphoesterase
MALVYWFADGVGKDVKIGGPDGTTPIPTAMVRWIRANGSPDLIVYGGDVYPSGDTSAFTEFFAQMDDDVTLMCEPPGNHDWKDDPNAPDVGRIPHGYDTFWQGHPESRQRVETLLKGGARYEHVIELDGWRLIFLDTGDYDEHPWPADDPSRVDFLNGALQPGRANIILAHHSRLSRGLHGDNDKLDTLWRTLFDDQGAPRAAFTLAGHDHNVSVYGPRSRDNPAGPSVASDQGIHVLVNGAGGDSLYPQQRFPFDLGISGTMPDLFNDDDHFCVTRINLIDRSSVDVDVLDFGKQARQDPVPVEQSLVRIRL